LAICFTLPNIGTVKILFPEKLWVGYMEKEISTKFDASIEEESTELIFRSILIITECFRYSSIFIS
jgi:hypothetical protein